MNKMQYTDVIALSVLGVALIMAILFSMSELATNIASGLIGYIGGASAMRKEGENKWQ